jgi:hypothetical protein
LKRKLPLSKRGPGLARVFSRAIAAVFLLTCINEQVDRCARIDISFGLSTLFWFQTVFWFSFDTFIDRYRYDGFRLVFVLLLLVLVLRAAPSFFSDLLLLHISLRYPRLNR